MKTYTLWRFKGPTSGETRYVVRTAEPDDLSTQHEYQRVMWRGEAESPADAETQARYAGVFYSDAEQREAEQSRINWEVER